MCITLHDTSTLRATTAATAPAIASGSAVDSAATATASDITSCHCCHHPPDRPHQHQHCDDENHPTSQAGTSRKMGQTTKGCKKLDETPAKNFRVFLPGTLHSRIFPQRYVVLLFIDTYLDMNREFRKHSYLWRWISGSLGLNSD